MIAVVLFIAAWCVGVASWFLGFAEAVGVWRFWPSVFRFGLCVLRETQSLPPPTAPIGSAFTTSSGKFKIVAPDLCFFRLQMCLFGFQMHTPFPLKCALHWQAQQATVEGRLPVFTSLFLAAWLVGWTSAGVSMAVAPGGLAVGLAFLAFGWTAVTAMCLFSIPFEIRRAREIISEYKAQCTIPASDSLVPSDASYESPAKPIL